MAVLWGVGVMEGGGVEFVVLEGERLEREREGGKELWAF